MVGYGDKGVDMVVRIGRIIDSIAGQRQKIMLTVILLEVMGIACTVWLKAGAENKANNEEYLQYVDNREAVITELNRLEVARQEDIKPMEALSAIVMTMPQQVKCRRVTIGNFHNGDWIVMEVESGEKGAIEDYLSMLRKNQYFSGMRIEDIKDGVRVTVPMPEGFLWQ